MISEDLTRIFLLLELLLDDSLGLHQRGGLAGLRPAVDVLRVHSELVLLAWYQACDRHCCEPERGIKVNIIICFLKTELFLKEMGI